MIRLQFILLLLVQWSLSTESWSRPLEMMEVWRNHRRTLWTPNKIPQYMGDNLSLASNHTHIHLVSSERMINKIFDEADSNHDGWIDFDEVYELILKILIQVNRRVPIPPPSKQKVLRVFQNADTTQNNKLNRAEFKGLANILVRRLVLRVIVHKLVTVVGAPLLAEYVLRTLTGVEWLHQFVQTMVPQCLKQRLLPILTSSTFWRTVLVVGFVSTLGNLVVDALNWFMDASLDDKLVTSTGNNQRRRR